MYGILKGLRVIEASSFVASPSAGLYLAQLGAEVIRVDTIGGGPDYNRWPKSNEGASFYWEGLNKGKKSVTVNIGTDEGKSLIQDLACAPGENGGILLTNFPQNGFLSYKKLKEKREDVIVARVMGQANGGPALDYTVNCSLGYPLMTGPQSLADDEPVNHVLPAWDLLAGAYAAFSLLAADKHRATTGEGGEYKIPLADIGVTAMANMGQLAEVLYQNDNRARHGNEVYGAFGKDFKTADGRRMMIMAITPRQWRGLLSVLEIEQQVTEVESARGVTFAKDEGVRYEHSDALYPLIESRVCLRQAAELQSALDAVGGCWGEYQSMREAAEDEVLVKNNPIFSEIKNPSNYTYPTPGSALTIADHKRRTPTVAPHLGQHSSSVLTSVLGLDKDKVSELIEQGVVGERNL
jgi:2-methylfumaryl-CoA isomerase|tara:strand:- start:3410 stop:4636 length:1227 start_codon:yes stop_codon:yes gene_type:complete